MKSLPRRFRSVNDNISAKICSTASWFWTQDQMISAFVTTYSKEAATTVE